MNYRKNKFYWWLALLGCALAGLASCHKKDNAADVSAGGGGSTQSVLTMKGAIR